MKTLLQKAPLVKASDAGEEFIHQFLETMSMAVYTCDAKGFIKLYNSAAIELWGREPVSNKDLWCGSWKIFRPDGSPLPLDECPMAIVLRGGTVNDNEEIVIQRRDGTARNVIPYPRAIVNREGELIGAINMLMDITEQKVAEKNTANLAAIVQFSDDAIVSKTLDGIVTSWNPAAEKLFGYKQGEMIGQPITKIIPADRLDEEPVIIDKIKRGELVDHFETKRMTKEGKLLDISLTISPIKNNKGTIIGASKIARDITDKKRDEQRKNEFLAVASHELKTPLTSIKAYAQLLTRTYRTKDDSFLVNALSKIENQVNKMTNLVGDFLNLSKIESDKFEIKIKSFDLQDLIDEIASDMQFVSLNHRILVKDKKPVEVLADRERIGQVITNLLTNAVKYSPEKETIIISTTHRNDSIRVMVEDKGIGIGPEEHDKIFQRFYRSKFQENISSGFGIGLYISAEIIRRHNGKIGVESDAGKGATFYFTLPLPNRAINNA